MARVRLSEYAAKKLLMGNEYRGKSVTSKNDVDSLILEDEEYVVKVDDGVKKRKKLGLLVKCFGVAETSQLAVKFLNDGHRRVLIEPLISHDEQEERYISCNLERNGVKVIYSKFGGIDVEMNRDKVIVGLVSLKDFLISNECEVSGVSSIVLHKLLWLMRTYFFSFVEINPYVSLMSGDFIPLDLAVELDSSKLHLLPEWVAAHVNKEYLLPEEKVVAQLNERSSSSFSLVVLNTSAPIFTLLSGGGASLVILDSFIDQGMQDLIGNYGEYSGAPTRMETKLYTDSILSLLFSSKSTRKVLIIAGGIANFTDISTTFLGIVDSCTGYLDDFKNHRVLVCVRRGGPHQTEGLALLESFFTKHNIRSIIYDPRSPFLDIAMDTKSFLETNS